MYRSKSEDGTALVGRTSASGRSGCDRPVSGVRFHPLAASKTPSVAVLLCSEWMAKRLEIIAQEQKDFAHVWVQLLLDVMAGDKPHRLNKSSATSPGKS